MPLQDKLSLLREPLAQFLIIGVVLFAVERVALVQADDPYEIIIDPEDMSRLVQVFTEGQGRPPSEEEVEELLVKWTQNEIFFREARAMGLDQGDEMMRSRLILKMRNVIFNRVVEQAPEEEELRNWFELNRELYDTPELYTIERLRLPEVDSVAEAEAVAASMDGQPLPDEQKPLVQEFRRRTVENIAAFLSPEEADELLQLRMGQWMPVEASGRHSLVRVTTVHEAVPAVFEDARYQAAKDFKKAASGLQVSEMAEEIAAKYRIHMEFDDADLDQALAAARNYEPSEVTAQSRSLKARAGVASGDEG
jgi:hypothetical protein